MRGIVRESKFDKVEISAKKIIRIALANDYISKDPFANIKFKLDEVERDFLEDSEIQRIIGKPIKSSLFGKPYGLEGLEKHYVKSNETIKTGCCTRELVSLSLATVLNGRAFRAKLQEQGIDLVLRYNEGDRLVGATYINHNDRTVMNGSALGKELKGQPAYGVIAP